MIQRKQSLFLLLAALLALSTWLFPIATYDMADGRYALRTMGLFDAQGVADPLRKPVLPFHLLHGLLAAVLLVSILLYGNRPRQARVVRMSYLLALGLFAFQYISRNSALAYLAQRGPVESGYGLSFWVPLLVLALAFAAERAIQADEDLVRSADRLR